MADKIHYGVSVLCTAASGRVLPSRGVTIAFVKACGGPVIEWTRRWEAERGGGEPQ